MSSPQPTPEIVRSLWAFMSERFGTRVISKDDAIEMRAAAPILDLMGIDGDRFLKHQATTIGHRIYVPFTVGIPIPNWDLNEQILTAVHEHQHVAQADREGQVRFSWFYLRDEADRARYEADARSAELEVHFWRFGKLPPPSDWVTGLEHYALGAEHVATARAILESRAHTIGHGGVYTTAGKAAIAWLNDQAPELRHQTKA
jgi:hypothetical protein